MNIFFDFDGTLIDCKERLYRLFADLTKSNKISIEDYWRLKRSMLDHDWILTNIFKYSDRQLSSFKDNWMDLIESEEYLNYNQLFDYTIPTLRSLGKHKLYLVTARQYEDKVIKEIIKFGIQQYFLEVLVSNHGKSKFELIIEMGVNISAEDFFVGDTEIDILTGKKLNISTVSVFSGFRGYESLLTYKPDYMISNISEIGKIIL